MTIVNFKKNRSNVKVKRFSINVKVLSQGKLIWNIKALALNVQKFKFSKKWVKLQGQGHCVKNNGTHGKVLSQGILTWNIKALALNVQKLLARLKFSKNGSNSKVKVTGQKIMVPTERSYHKNTHVKYQSSSTHCAKVISKVKVSERRTEWQTWQKPYASWSRRVPGPGKTLCFYVHQPHNKPKNLHDERFPVDRLT